MLIHCSSFAARWIAFSAVALLICAELSSASARPRPRQCFSEETACTGRRTACNRTSAPPSQACLTCTNACADRYDRTERVGRRQHRA
jgi:hypothetical protein